MCIDMALNTNLEPPLTPFLWETYQLLPFLAHSLMCFTKEIHIGFLVRALPLRVRFRLSLSSTLSAISQTWSHLNPSFTMSRSLCRSLTSLTTCRESVRIFLVSWGPSNWELPNHSFLAVSAIEDLTRSLSCSWCELSCHYLDLSQGSSSSQIFSSGPPGCTLKYVGSLKSRTLIDNLVKSFHTDCELCNLRLLHSKLTR